MTLARYRQQLWFRAALSVGLWTLIGVFITVQSWITIESAREIPHQKLARVSADNVPTERLLLVALGECYLWAALAILIFHLARRFPPEGRHWGRRLLVHVTAGIVAAAAHTFLAFVIRMIFFERFAENGFSVDVVQFFFAVKFPSGLIIYALILGISLAINYYRQYRDRELRTSHLETLLAQTRLQVLKMQLHPHFLFNTLNAISALIHQDVDLADHMIARLGDLLRSTLQNADLQEVSLAQELDFIQPYLEIEQARLGSRLSVQIDIQPDTIDAAVPNLILQPLVENAIRHGIAPRSEPGRIEIRARRTRDTLHLQVCDNGPGLPNPSSETGRREACVPVASRGIGLANTRARLQQLYGDAHRFQLENGNGLEVTVSIPFRQLPESQSPRPAGG
jgi:signal transduction histidine kinase